MSIHPVGLWDDTMYHLPMVRYYVEQAGFACAETLRFPLFPQNMDVLFGLGFLLYGANTVYGEVFIQLLASLPLLLTMFGIIAASSRYMGTSCPGFLGAVMLLFFETDNNRSRICLYRLWNDVILLVGVVVFGTVN